MQIQHERLDRVNWSTLKDILRSPRHYLHRLNNPRTDSDALLRGRAIHCAVYEPHLFDERYTVQPKFNRAMNDETAIAKGYAGGKQAAAAWDEANATREVITADMHFDVIGMARALQDDPVSSRLLNGAEGEVNIEWTDPVTGILCRGRVDHLNGCLADLKSTARIDSCERDAARFLYHAQLAWYFDGCIASGRTFTAPPCLIFVESVAPFDVLVLDFDDAAIEAGRAIYRRALNTLAECRSTGIWPGIGRGASRGIRLPSWETQQTETITEELAEELLA